MCGRYTLNKQADDLAKRYNIAKLPADIKPNYNVAPSQTMPIITEDDSGKKQVELMQWGIPRKLYLGGKMVEKEIINTRADKAFGGFWKKTVTNHRCLIPADGFYEWKRPPKGTKEHKAPYYIHPKQIELFSFAGIWDIWKGADGREVKVYSIMTTDPNKEMRAVHDRMPVILHPQDESAWLEPSNDDPGELGALLFPYEDNGLEMYRVSEDVNSPRNNSADLLQPLPGS